MEEIIKQLEKEYSTNKYAIQSKMWEQDIPFMYEEVFKIGFLTAINEVKKALEKFNYNASLHDRKISGDKLSRKA